MIDIDAKPTRLVFEAEAVVILDGSRPRLAPTSVARWDSMLAKVVGQTVHITVEKARLRRSSEASNYLWGVVYVDLLDGLRRLAVEAGEACPFVDREDLHEAMKYLFLGTETVAVPGGGRITRPRKSSVLDEATFSGFIESVSHWGAERGIYVRPPEHRA